jgi:serine phosphatase RsbU (regulator of sigma subunit)
VASLVGIAGPVAGRQFQLGHQEYVMGRGSAASIRLSDPGVSRQHARLLHVRGSYEVEDLKSFNGTYVNGRRIQRLRLRDGDEVRICRDVFRFDADPADELSSEVVFDQGLEESVVGQIDASMIAEALQDPDLQASDVEGLSRKLRAVAAVSEAIATTLDPDELFDRVLDQVLASFPQADKASVLLRNEESGKLEVHAMRTKPGLKQPTFGGGLSLSHTVIHQVMSEGHAVVAQPLVTSNGGAIKPDRCRMGAPIIYQREIKGVVHVDATHTRHVFTEADLDLLTSIAMQTAVALQVAAFHQKILKQNQLEQDLQFARRVQQGFLPNSVPQVDRYLFAAHYDPAFHVGGDFYDFIDLGDGRLAIITADVSGHGISAALFMARLSSYMRSFAVADREPAKVLKRTESLLEENQDGMFATILYLVLDTRTGRLVMSNAGHMPPILRRPPEGDVRSHDEVTGLVLGVLPEQPIIEHHSRLLPGDTILLYSDGVVEARNEEDQEYGVGRLRWICGQGDPSAPALVHRILRDFDRHVGGQDHADDVTLVAFTFTG